MVRLYLLLRVDRATSIVGHVNQIDSVNSKIKFTQYHVHTIFHTCHFSDALSNRFPVFANRDHPYMPYDSGAEFFLNVHRRLGVYTTLMLLGCHQPRAALTEATPM